MRFHESKSDPSSSTSATTMLVKANTASPVFGVSPYSVNVAPAMTETPCHRSITSSTLFNQKTNSSFAFNNPTNNSWQINKSIAASSTVTGVVAAEPMNKLIRPASKFRSISSGKSLQNMQELARTNMIHSDDSAEESSDDDSTIITTTASEKESDSENEATIPIRRSVQTAIANQTSLNMAHKPSFKQNDAPS
uniref:Uncharacterized protein n=1 Tax=Ciona savignyi TaxID=51511 RepID=H2Z7T3_CIOSA